MRLINTVYTCNSLYILQEGFEGVNCSHNIDECLSSPCENNATCTDAVNAFYCNCSTGQNNCHLTYFIVQQVFHEPCKI